LVGLVPLGFKADQTGDAWLCGCKATAGKPYCDGSHKKL
jgi:CDGSH-type Zn-finger protein